MNQIVGFMNQIAGPALGEVDFASAPLHLTTSSVVNPVQIKGLGILQRQQKLEIGRRDRGVAIISITPSLSHHIVAARSGLSHLFQETLGEKRLKTISSSLIA